MLWWIAIAGGLALSPASASPGPGERLALVDVTVVPLESEALLGGQTVLIEGGHIVDLGPTGELAIPAGARIVDGGGRYLLPGLADMHAHLPEEREVALRILEFHAAMGVTTIAVLDGHPEVLRLRQEATEGRIVSPRIISSGPTIRGEPPRTMEQGAALVSEQIEAGYDLIKVYNGVPEAAYSGIIEQAGLLGVPVIGHSVRAVGYRGCIEMGQHVAHMEEVVYGHFTWNQTLPEEVEPMRARLRELLDSSQVADIAWQTDEAGVYVLPNLVAYHWILRQVDDLATALDRPEVRRLPALLQKNWGPEQNGYTNGDNQDVFLARLELTYPFLLELTSAFHEAGVPLLLGTDAPLSCVVPGYAAHEDLEELVAAGLSPYAALRAASVNAAAFLGESDWGSARPGMRADLVLLEQNPLEDIGRTRGIAGVVLAGRWLERAELDRLLGLE